jgi:hypothetical protein
MTLSIEIITACAFNCRRAAADRAVTGLLFSVEARRVVLALADDRYWVAEACRGR